MDYYRAFNWFILSVAAASWFVGDEFAFVELWVLGLVAVDAVFDLASELSDQSLDGPGSGVTEGANRVTFDLVRKFLEHVNLSEVGVSELHAFKHIDHPAGTLATGCALAATLVLVELGET